MLISGEVTKRLTRAAAMVSLVLLVPACTAFQTPEETRLLLIENEVPAIDDPVKCLMQLGGERPVQKVGLNPDRIRVLSWNLEKGQHDDALYQLGVLSSDADIVSIQEAPLTEGIIDEFPNLPVWSFAPGYQSKDNLTGVMTLSRVAPLTHCVFTSQEPWLGTPKATSLIEFPIQGRSETVLSINLHAVNFTLTPKALDQQLRAFESLIESHSGPVFLSGDFNTWSDARMAAVEQFAADNGLSILEFDYDRRTLVFDKVLDHVLVRGIEVVESTSYEVDTSDHNALRVEMRLTELDEVSE